MKARAPSQFWMVRHLRARPRLWTSVAVGAVCYAIATILFSHANVVTRLLIGWDFGVLFYLIVVAMMMSSATPATIRRHAAMQDEGGFAILILTVAAAVASLGAIFVELGSADSRIAGYGLYAARAVATVILSWAFIHTIFALHYAYEFYGSGARANGLKFPGDSQPDYWDFVYFSFVIGMTFQVSDVAVTHKGIRRTVVSHGALSFFYATAVIALTVNIAASGLAH